MPAQAGVPSVAELVSPGENFEIVLVGKNLEDPAGGLVAWDDITVDFEPCASGPSATTTAAPATAATGGTQAPPPTTANCDKLNNYGGRTLLI